MKYIYQATIIFGFTFLGELLHILLPLPVPAAIYGLVLLFLALQTGIVKLAGDRPGAAAHWGGAGGIHSFGLRRLRPGDPVDAEKGREVP